MQGLDGPGKRARVDKWATIDDPSQLEKATLEFPLELRTQITELKKLHQILNIQEVHYHLFLTTSSPVSDSHTASEAYRPTFQIQHSVPRGLRARISTPAIPHIPYNLVQGWSYAVGNLSHHFYLQALIPTALH